MSIIGRHLVDVKYTYWDKHACTIDGLELWAMLKVFFKQLNSNRTPFDTETHKHSSEMKFNQCTKPSALSPLDLGSISSISWTMPEWFSWYEVRHVSTLSGIEISNIFLFIHPAKTIWFCGKIQLKRFKLMSGTNDCVYSQYVHPAGTTRNQLEQMKPSPDRLVPNGMVGQYDKWR